MRDLPLNSRWFWPKWMSANFRELARFIDGTNWETSISGVCVGKQWGVFIVWRRRKTPQ